MTIAAASMTWRERIGPWRAVLLWGLLFAGVALYVALVGFVGKFADRGLIQDVVSLGQAVLILTGIVAGYVGARRAPEGPTNAVIGAAITGLMAGAALSLLILLGPRDALDLRQYFPNASPALYDVLSGGEYLDLESSAEGFWFPALVGISLGAIGGILALLPHKARLLLVASVAVLVSMGLFSNILRNPWLQQDSLKDLARTLFASDGLTITGAVVVLVIVVIAFALHQWLRPGERVRRMPPRRRRAVAVPMTTVLLIIVLLIPLPATIVGLPNYFSLGPSVALSVALIALYVMMGLGLNITLGLAGLLDLGFVAFFAVGAYAVGLLTSVGGLGIAEWPFWLAIPFAVLAAMAFGVVLGLPILGIRGDYLAIATLAFGEIIRILAISDLLKPVIGGADGIREVPKPIDVPASDPLSGAVQIYYVALVSAGIIAFVAYRLRESRLGRAWVAIREDEDVAEALGVNLVQTKSLAYMLGAAFAGLGGACFAALFGSINPTSIRLDVSILVVCVVIIGGMGSIPGVILGAIFIIGLPELFLREFAEFRFLMYGIALIAIMHLRPEGLLPSRVGRQEMHHDDGQTMEGDAATGPPGDSGVPTAHSPERA
jgi:branched-chain amino acid transport system permease protein